MPLQAEVLGLSVAPAERRCSHAVKWAAHLTVEHPTPWAAEHLIWLRHPVVAAQRWVLVGAAVTAVRIELSKREPNEREARRKSRVSFWLRL
jgi:chloramphenicol 3-O-phosphotransferase